MFNVVEQKKSKTFLLPGNIYVITVSSLWIPVFLSPLSLLKLIILDCSLQRTFCPEDVWKHRQFKCSDTVDSCHKRLNQHLTENFTMSKIIHFFHY